MGNPREWTTKFNARNEALRAFLKASGCSSMRKRKAAMDRAVSLPNRLPSLRAQRGVK